VSDLGFAVILRSCDVFFGDLTCCCDAVMLLDDVKNGERLKNNDRDRYAPGTGCKHVAEYCMCQSQASRGNVREGNVQHTQ
jgi:hypothetical protein